MLAGIIASPSVYDPKVQPRDRARPPQPGPRRRCATRATSRRSTTGRGSTAPCPSPDDIEPPTPRLRRPRTSPPGCASSWSTATAPAKAFFGGLKVKTTLDLELQDAAEEAVCSYLGGIAPTASVVVIDNDNAASRRWSAGPTTRRPRSTSRPRDTASLGPRSSRSSSTTALDQGDLPLHRLRLRAADLLLRQEEGGVLPGLQLRGQLPGLGRHRHRHPVLRQLGLLADRPRQPAALRRRPPENGIRGGTHAIARTIHGLGVATRSPPTRRWCWAASTPA